MGQSLTGNQPQQRLVEMESQVDDLTRQLSEKEQQRNEEASKKHQEDIKELQSVINAQNLQIEDLKDTLQEKEKQLITSEKEQGTLEGELKGQLNVKGQQKTARDQQVTDLQEQLRASRKQITDLQEQLTGRDENVTELEEQLQARENREMDQITVLQAKMTARAQQVLKLQRILSGRTKQITDLQGQLTERDEQVTDLQEKLAAGDERVTDLQGQLTARDEQVTHLQGQLKASKQQVTGLQGQLKGKDQQVIDLQALMAAKEQQLTELEKQVTASSEKATDLQGQLKGKDQQVTELQGLLTARDQQVTELQGKLTKSNQEVTDLQGQLTARDRQVTDQKGRLAASEKQVTDLKEKLTVSNKQVIDLRGQLTARVQQDWVVNRDEIELIEDEVLGEGTWGRVVQGKFRRSNVAVKQISEDILSPDKRACFAREVSIVSGCRHPRLLQFIGATNDDKSLLLVTELMDRSLRSLYEEKPLNEGEIFVISLDVAEALNYLHRHKPTAIIHRDISSTNVLLWQQGDKWRGKVSDHVTANFFRECGGNNRGAAIYCAPEATSGAQDKKLSCKFDVYSFGVLICEVYTRELPDPERRAEQVGQVTSWRPWSRLIRPCLRSTPAWRPEMEEIIDELENQLNGATMVEQRPSCNYQETCRKFVSSLELRDAYFDANFDLCYCTECHTARHDKLYYDRGEPPKTYGIPVGWCRFGIKAQSQAAALHVFDKWHRAFHGTRPDSVKKILECGNLLLPGDVTLEGKQLSEGEGHFNEMRKPEGFDTKRIFVSPSVLYAGNDCYAESIRFEEPSTKKTFAAKTVFQLCIKPNCYETGKETIGSARAIDPHFKNEELEWSTRQRGATILYGLLINLDDTHVHDSEDESEEPEDSREGESSYRTL